MYEFQYIVGGMLSLLVSIYILMNRPRTLALKFLCTYGLFTLFWEFSVFLSKTAPTATEASNFYFLVILTSHASLAAYLLTIVNIQKERKKKLNFLIAIPSIIQILVIPLGYFESYKFSYSDFGWYYSVNNIQLPVVFVSLIFIGYLLGIITVLALLVKKTDFPILRKKYSILLVSFIVFQAIGPIFTNALIAFDFLSPGFRIGGILQFLTFLSISSSSIPGCIDIALTAKAKLVVLVHWDYNY